jgi:hypothetical protein
MRLDATYNFVTTLQNLGLFPRSGDNVEKNYFGRTPRSRRKVYRRWAACSHCSLSLALLCIFLSSVLGQTLLSSYPFTREGCGVGTFEDTQPENVLGNLAASGTPLVCGAGDGITTTPDEVSSILTSAHNITELRGRLINGITFATWIKQTDGAALDNPLLSIRASTVSLRSRTNCEAFLAIWQGYDDGNVMVEMCDDSGGYMCTQFFSQSLSFMGNLTHLALTVETLASGVKYVLWVDGVLKKERTFPASTCPSLLAPSSWADQSQLVVLSNPSRQGAWQGTLYSLDVYNTALTAAEMSQATAVGPRNSPPLAVSNRITIQQNGEVGDHSGHPMFYNTEIPAAELAMLNLQASDVDDAPTSPLFNASVGSTLRVCGGLVPA